MCICIVYNLENQFRLCNCWQRLLSHVVKPKHKQKENKFVSVSYRWWSCTRSEARSPSWVSRAQGWRSLVWARYLSWCSSEPLSFSSQLHPFQFQQEHSAGPPLFSSLQRIETRWKGRAGAARSPAWMLTTHSHALEHTRQITHGHLHSITSQICIYTRYNQRRLNKYITACLLMQCNSALQNNSYT